MSSFRQRVSAARLIIASALMFILFASAVYGANSDRVALVIGNSAYQHVPQLDNPGNDASDIAASLARLDFEVTLMLDQGVQEMRQLIEAFGQKAQKADLSLLYFAGHGIEIGTSNFLIPVDAQLRSDTDASSEAIALSEVMSTFSGANGVKLVLIDACRNNPFVPRLKASGATRSIGRGLGRVDPIGGVLEGGILLSYSAREGTLALDGEGRNSPYAQGLLENLEEPGLEVSKLFRQVRDRVFETTGGRQEPFTYGSLPGIDIFLKLPAESNAEELSGERLFAELAAAKHVDTFRGWQLFAAKHSERAYLPETLLATEKAIARDLRDITSGVFVRGNHKDIPEKVAVEYENVFGLSDADVLVAQAFLIRNGYSIGAVDGRLGPKSRKAIAGFQRSVDLQPTGILTPATAFSLGLRLRWWEQIWPVSSPVGRRYDINQIERL